MPNFSLLPQSRSTVFAFLARVSRRACLFCQVTLKMFYKRLHLLTVHDRRHLSQAEQVRNHPDFPKY